MTSASPVSNETQGAGASPSSGENPPVSASPTSRETPLHRASLDEQIERAYCDAYMRRVIEAELDPTNFTKAMRDRKRQQLRPSLQPL